MSFNKTNWSWCKDRYEIKEWEQPKVNMNKGQRPRCDKILVEYKFNKKTLQTMQQKYDKKWEHEDIWWSHSDLNTLQTQSAPNPSINSIKNEPDFSHIFSYNFLTEKEINATKRRPHSSRNLIVDKQDLCESKQITDDEFFRIQFDPYEHCERELITMDKINFKQMILLVYGYIRQQYDQFMDDLIQIVLMKCDVLETFDGNKQRKISLASLWNSQHHCYLCYERLDSLPTNGYNHGVKYVSINFQDIDCVNEFGVTNKTDAIERWENKFPEILKIKNVKEYKMTFTEYYGNGIITIKLDCENWMITFYKNYNEILREQSIQQNQFYFFYVRYCHSGRQEFEIIATDVAQICKYEELDEFQEILWVD